MIIRIIDEVQAQIGNDSIRNRNAQKLADAELKIEKDGHWYIVTLREKSVKIYANTQRISRKIDSLLSGNSIFKDAKEMTKEQFRK